jgi:hypothetical protein
MAYLFEETAPERRRELNAHLAACTQCSAQVQGWRSSLVALDDWRISAPRSSKRQWQPALKWAAAAAMMLVVGFGLGRRTAPGAADLAELKTSVARLSENLRQDRNTALTNAVQVATATASAETSRMFEQFALLQEEQRAADQNALKLAFQTLDAKVQKVQAAVETVALNTQESFQQTHQNLTRLASSLPLQNPAELLNREK